MEEANLKSTKNTEMGNPEPFKTFESEEDFKNFIKEKTNVNEQRFRIKLESEIKSKLEKEAEFTAEEKLNERIKELETEKKAVLIDKNRTKAEREFVTKGLNNCAEILDFIISEDENLTLENANKIIGFIEINSKNIADEKIKKTMQDVTKPENSEVNEQNSHENIAQKLGKFTSETQKTALDTIKKYL